MIVVNSYDFPCKLDEFTWNFLKMCNYLKIELNIKRILSVAAEPEANSSERKRENIPVESYISEICMILNEIFCCRHSIDMVHGISCQFVETVFRKRFL